MLILYVSDRWSVLGGADWHLVSIIDSLPADFHAAGLFGRSDGSAPHNLALTGGLHYIKKLDRQAPFASEKRVGEELGRAVAAINPDLIHVHNVLNPHFLETLAESRPAVITVQDHRYFCPGRGKVKEDGRLCQEVLGLHCAGCFEKEEHFFKISALVRARLEALTDFAAVIVPSVYLQKELSLAGVDSTKIQVIPPFVHGLDQTSGPAGFGRNVLFAGRIVWAKGVFDLLKAMTLVNGNVRLMVSGAGTVDQALADKTAELRLKDRIEFLGWTPHQAMAGLYRRARLVVMPSRWQEPFGLVGLEAQALARPVLAYDVGGIKEWLQDGRTGLTVPAGNTLALAAGMNLLMREPDEATALGRAGQIFVREKFNPEILIQKLTGLYREIGA